MKRFRSIRDAIKEIREEDPKSAISEFAVRDAVRSGEIPSKKVNTKFIISIEDVLQWYEG